MSNIFTFGSGDWPFLFKEQLSMFSSLPYIWDLTRGNGFGENIAYTLWSRFYLNTNIFLFHHLLHFDWLIIEFIIFWIAFAAIGIISSLFLLKTFFPESNPFFKGLGVAIYLSNTYIIMILDGGQLGILLAYAIAPLVFSQLFLLSNTFKKSLSVVIQKVLVLSLLVSLQILFDPRIFYVTLVGSCAFVVLYLTGKRESKTFIKVVGAGLLVGFFVFLLHSFWLLPLLFRASPTFVESTGVNASRTLVDFFSFSDLPHTISLLHPNWPENIFGKVSFMKPEFLILPIIAFSSLLFRRHITITCFVITAIFAAFVAKGTKEPFGDVYYFMYEYVPGFTMFRDSTKWYLFVALPFAVLIPFTLQNISLWISARFSKPERPIAIALSLALLTYWVFLLAPLAKGTLTGALKVHKVPQEYTQLKDKLNNNTEFYRTMWIPQRQKFGYYSHLHPAVDAQEYFKISDPLKIAEQMRSNSRLNEQLQQDGIRYIVIPQDSQNRLFLDDRKYSDEIRNKTLQLVSSVSWLDQDREFTSIGLFRLGSSRDLFSTNAEVHIKNWHMVNPTTFYIDVEATEPYELIFSQRFDPQWKAYINKNVISSNEGSRYENIFEISKEGAYTITVSYLPQRYLEIGYAISSIAIVSCIGGVFYLRKRSV